MSVGRKSNRSRIPFSEVRSGDRLRVRYTEGGREVGASFSPVRCVSVTRTLVSEVAVSALDKVWLSSDGRTVVHRDWDDLEIIRLSEG